MGGGVGVDGQRPTDRLVEEAQAIMEQRERLARRLRDAADRESSQVAHSGLYQWGAAPVFHAIR